MAVNHLVNREVGMPTIADASFGWRSAVPPLKGGTVGPPSPGRHANSPLG